MTTSNKLVEDFRAKIKGIFKENADAMATPATMEPSTNAPPITDAAASDPVVEEEKVTLSVSLLKSLLDWAHGEEEAEEEEVGGEAGEEVAPTDEISAPVVEAEETSEVAPEAIEGGEEGEELEDAGVEAIEIQALVDKIKELAQTKGELTDEDFGEIVAAAESAEEGAEGGEGGEENLEGILGGEGEVAPETEIKENIGEIIPKGAKFKNEGNKGIGK
jgi:hypothetical protein